MRSEHRVHAAHHRRLHLQHTVANDEVPSYLGPITGVDAVHLAPGLRTAAETLRSEIDPDNGTSLAEAS